MIWLGTQMVTTQSHTIVNTVRKNWCCSTCPCRLSTTGITSNQILSVFHELIGVVSLIPMSSNTNTGWDLATKPKHHIRRPGNGARQLNLSPESLTPPWKAFYKDVSVTSDCICHFRLYLRLIVFTVIRPAGFQKIFVKAFLFSHVWSLSHVTVCHYGG